MKFYKILVQIVLCSVFTFPVFGEGYNLLVGGGSLDDNCDLSDGHWSDLVLQWFVDRAQTSGPNGGNGRILIVDYETYPECDQSSPGSFVGECAYFTCLGAVKADHVCIAGGSGGRASSCLDPNSAEVSALLQQYDGLWFRGGDQSKYTENWKNTATETAIYDVWSAGGVLGGTSAGAMIQSEVVSTGDAPSWEATGNPFVGTIELTADFLSGPHTILPETIVDSHFITRARLGRLSVFLGRLRQATGIPYLGIGIDPETALAVEPGGASEVIGEGSVTFISPTPETEIQLSSRRPPHISQLHTQFLTQGFRYDLTTRSIIEVPPSATPADPFPPAVEFGSTVVEGAVNSDSQKASWFITNPTQSDALWHGKLNLAEGTPGLDNGLVTTNLEDSTDFRENRAGGPLWGLKQTRTQGLVVYTDGYNGSNCNAVQLNSDETLTALGGQGCPSEQSLIVVDCCGLEWVDQSTWDSDGDGNNRQSVALTPCRTTLWNSQLGDNVYRPRCLDQQPEPFCGDSVCGNGEDSCSCPSDCGIPPSTETQCSDGLDNDCDGLVDDSDSDCSLSCLPEGAACSTNSQCCSGSCRGRPGSKQCFDR